MENSKFCMFCGEKIDGDAIICPICGRQVEDTEPLNNNIDNNSVNNISNNNDISNNTSDIGKNSKKKKIIIAVVIVIVIAVLCGNYKKLPKYSWSSDNILPKPSSKYGEITIDNDTSFDMKVLDVSEDDFKEYIEDCKSYGFTIDSELNSSWYEAFNSEGYKVKIYWYSDNEMDIMLDYPMKVKTINWETSNISKLIPVPKSNTVNISWENSDGFAIYITNMSIDDFDLYVIECSNYGYNVDYRKGDDYYYASNVNGDKLTINYEGFNTIRISFNKNEEIDNEDNSNTDNNNDNDNDTNDKTDISISGVNPEFKELMDTYEAFYVEYFDFMDRYANSGYDPSLTTEYYNFLSKYSDYLSKLGSYNQDNLSSADYAYYLQVWSRILNMISEN